MSVVGIDLGTTNTVVACVRNGRVHVIADEHGQRLLPSVVSFHPNGTVLVGREAKARMGVDGKNTVSSVKRLIGRPWNSDELVKARQRFPFDMREGPGQGALVLARGQEYTLPEISAFVLKRAKQMAEAALGEVVDKAVITVPAHFNELQRASTKVAGRVAGLEVLRILNEPTAAALAYGLGRQNNERIAVYDFGGGTFDCTLLDLSGNVFEVLASAGDTFLGGDDVDGVIADRMCDAFLAQYRYDPRSDTQAFARLKLAAEQIKMDLSVNDLSQLRLREIAYGVGGAHLDLTFGFTRAELEALLAPLVERSFKVTQDAMSLARIAPSSFDHVILVGGSTRIPMVRRRVEQFFGMPPLDRVNPDEVVAIGAAIQAAALSDQLRRRSIPPPPPGAAGVDPRRSSRPPQPLGSAHLGNIPPTPHVPTQRGLSDPSLRNPGGAPSSGATLDERTAHASPSARPPMRIDANAAGADPTLSVNRTVTTPGVSGPPATVPRGAPGADFAPPSRTLPLDNTLNTLNTDSVTRPAAAAPGTQRLPGAPIVPAAGRPPPIPPPPRAASQRPPSPTSPPSPTRTASKPPPLPRMDEYEPDFPEDRSLTQEFPDPMDLPTPFEAWTPGGPLPGQRTGRTPPPVPPPPRAGAPRSSAPPVPSAESPSAQMKTATPSRGFQAFGAIDDLPSMMTGVSTSSNVKVPAPQAGQPSPLGDPDLPARTSPPGRNVTAPSPQHPGAYAAFRSAPPVQMAPPPGAPSPYASTQMSPQMPPPPLPPPPGPMAPPMAPMIGGPRGMEMLPPAVGGFSVPPQAAAPVLVDVTPRALVVEVVGGYCDTIIPRNAKIPCERKRQFTTGSDYQSVVRVRVAQGEHSQFMQNTYLGEVELSGIRPATRGEVQIGVTFELDADGSLRVRATDIGTGQEAVATLQLVGLATDESSIVSMIDRMAQQQIAH